MDPDFVIINNSANKDDEGETKEAPAGESAAVAYLDLWERQICRAAVHRDLSGRIPAGMKRT